MNGELIAVPTGGGNTALAQIRGEMETMIELANRYPRNIEQAVRNSAAMACEDKDTAGSCFYSLPPRGADQKRITGPSVRLAEIMAQQWGRMNVECRIGREEEGYVTAEAVAFDFETMTRFKVEKRRRITKKDGSRYGDDGVEKTVNAVLSIAKRDAIFQLIPRMYVNKVYEAARTTALDGAKSMKERRFKLVEHWEKQGIPKKKLLEHLGYKDEDSITVDDLDYLLGVWTAIKNKDYDVSDAFDAPRHQPEKAEFDVDAVKPAEKQPEPPKADAKPPKKKKEPEPEPEQDATVQVFERLLELRKEKGIPNEVFDQLVKDVSDDRAVTATALNAMEVMNLIAALENWTPPKPRTTEP
jgi:hypothetical protein